MRLNDIAIYETRRVPDPDTSSTALRARRGWWGINTPHHPAISRDIMGQWLGYNRGEAADYLERSHGIDLED